MRVDLQGLSRVDDALAMHKLEHDAKHDLEPSARMAELDAGLVDVGHDQIDAVALADVESVDLGDVAIKEVEERIQTADLVKGTQDHRVDERRAVSIVEKQTAGLADHERGKGEAVDAVARLSPDHMLLEEAGDLARGSQGRLPVGRVDSASRSKVSHGLFEERSERRGDLRGDVTKRSGVSLPWGRLPASAWRWRLVPAARPCRQCPARDRSARHAERDASAVRKLRNDPRSQGRAGARLSRGGGGRGGGWRRGQGSLEQHVLPRTGTVDRAELGDADRAGVGASDKRLQEGRWKLVSDVGDGADIGEEVRTRAQSDELAEGLSGVLGFGVVARRGHPEEARGRRCRRPWTRTTCPRCRTGRPPPRMRP
ncbi:hypothetical protein L1887_48997 [Cichorium endivia]|nr:hypothetical protein L1887_48997 [Cichorium endivia]